MPTVGASHVIVLPGGGYAEHSPNEGTPVARWLNDNDISASVFLYPLQQRQSHSAASAPCRDCSAARRRRDADRASGILGRRPPGRAPRPRWPAGRHDSGQPVRQRSGCKPYGQTRTAAPPSSETTAAKHWAPASRARSDPRQRASGRGGEHEDVVRVTAG